MSESQEHRRSLLKFFADHLGKHKHDQEVASIENGVHVTEQKLGGKESVRTPACRGHAAQDYAVGTMRKGGDGCMWKVAAGRTGRKRWSKCIANKSPT